MLDALRAGLSVDAFWSMTPREVYLAFGAAEWRDKQQEKAELAMAWYTAALSRVKRLPSLKSLLAPLTEHKAMTPEEIAEREAEFAELSARMGGNLGRRGNRTRKGSHSDKGNARQTR